MSQEKNILKLTPAAQIHIQKMIERRGHGVGFRIAVKKTGCSGYMYIPEIVDQAKAGDVLIKSDAPFQLYVDGDCLELLQGTEIDFVSKGLGQQQLEFHNPNADSLCGCGESFNVKKDDEQ